MTYMKDYSLKLVDGYLIRQTLDDDFHILHASAVEGPYHYDTKLYIPANEIWLDYRYKAEQDFLLEMHFFAEKNDLPTNTPFATERKMVKEKLCQQAPVANFKTERRKGTAPEPDIVLVDGSVVRKFLDPHFVSGGHRFV